MGKMGRIADDEAEAIRAELSGTVDHNFLRFMAPAFLHHNSKKQRSRSSSVEAGTPPTLAEDVVAQKIEQLSVEMLRMWAPRSAGSSPRPSSSTSFWLR